MPAKQTRSFTFTNYNLETDYRRIIEQKQIQFIAYGLETCPTSGRLHHQGFLYMVNYKATGKRSCGKIGKLISPTKPAHIAPMRGNFLQNESYCSKESSLIKHGTPPRQGFRSDLKETMDMIKKGSLSLDEIALGDPHMYNMYHRTFSVAERMYKRCLFRTEMTKGIWLYGPTGTGKSKYWGEKYNPATDYKHKLGSKWWDNYDGHETVILDEFRGQMTRSELLSLCDRHPYEVDRRYHGPTPFLAKQVIITSCMHPCEVYKNITTGWDQFRRRYIVLLCPTLGKMEDVTETVTDNYVHF